MTTRVDCGGDPAAHAPTDMADLVERLQESGFTVSAMESCTGGLLMASITRHPGSGFLLGGLVAYDAGAKVAFGVPAETIEEHGVVSAETAAAMARAVAARFGTEIGVGITGEAGPDSDSGAAPGTVYIALDHDGDLATSKLCCRGDRESVREHAVIVAASMLSAALAREPAAAG